MRFKLNYWTRSLEGGRNNLNLQWAQLNLHKKHFIQVAVSKKRSNVPNTKPSSVNPFFLLDYVQVVIKLLILIPRASDPEAGQDMEVQEAHNTVAFLLLDFGLYTYQVDKMPKLRSRWTVWTAAIPQQYKPFSTLLINQPTNQSLLFLLQLLLHRHNTAYDYHDSINSMEYNTSTALRVSYTTN